MHDVCVLVYSSCLNMEYQHKIGLPPLNQKARAQYTHPPHPRAQKCQMHKQTRVWSSCFGHGDGISYCGSRRGRCSGFAVR
jgi:hypothetical protein